MANLQSFELADREIDDDAVGVEALSLNAGLETAGGGGGAECFFHGQFTLEVFDQHLVLGDNQNLGHRFVFEIAQRHAMLFEEADQVFAGNPTVLGTGDSIAL